DAIPYEQIARQLNRGIVTLRSDVGRLRSRFRAILREEVRGTLSDPTEVADELRYLCQVLAQT
ncbi:MAG: sigma-70 family RNA polymerase sigma factor, partial [Chthoniobacterales bacterium]